MKPRIFILFILFLVFVDILIKVIIELYYIETSFNIIPPYVSFYPMYNKDFSYVNHVFEWGIGKTLHLSITIAIVIFLFLYYDFSRYTLPHEKILPLALSFGIAASICNIIGVVYFGGILDYIYIRGLFIFDLKDVYIVIFIALVALRHCNTKNRGKLRLINFSEYLTYRLKNKKKE